MPGGAATRALQRREQREVGEPALLRDAEALQGLTVLGRGLALERGVGLREQRPLELDHRPEIDVVPREGLSRLQVGIVQQTGVTQSLEARQQWIAGKGGEALVR